MHDTVMMNQVCNWSHSLKLAEVTLLSFVNLLVALILSNLTVSFSFSCVFGLYQLPQKLLSIERRTNPLLVFLFYGICWR